MISRAAVGIIVNKHGLQLGEECSDVKRRKGVVCDIQKLKSEMQIPQGKLWWPICANLRFVVFSFCRGEKMITRQHDNHRLFAPKRRQIDKTKSRQDDKIKAKRRQTQLAN
jgi:hypothetical protein